MRKLAYALAGAIVASPVYAQDITVAVTAFVEHPALDAVRDGVRDYLASQGYCAAALPAGIACTGTPINFVYESAQANMATTNQIAAQFVSMNPTIIVPIATPSAQAVVSATTTIPVVFGAVTDPLDAGLVTDIVRPGANVTGVSDLTPVADQLALFLEIQPDMQTIGVLYNPAEANAVVLVNLLKEAAAANNIAVVEATATNTANVQAAAASLVGRVDAIYVPTDNTIVTAFEAVVGVAEDAGIPLYAGDGDSVARGAIASIGFDYYAHGLQTGAIVVRVLRGENPGDIPVEFATGGEIYINPAAAERMGITVPQAVIDRAAVVVP